jgi:hypothetical protein
LEKELAEHTIDILKYSNIRIIEKVNIACRYYYTTVLIQRPSHPEKKKRFSRERARASENERE